MDISNLSYWLQSCRSYPSRNRKFSLWDNRLAKEEEIKKDKKVMKRKNESINIYESKEGT
jgi:hypothetical protein